MGWVIRAIASGLVAFAVPRIAIGAGLPLDKWAIRMGEWLGASINPDAAIWGITLVLGIALFGIESWRHPVERLWNKVTGRGSLRQQTDSPSSAPVLPDWSMKELCLHVLNAIDDSDEVIREIEAKARLGTLSCWGRRYSASIARQNPNPPSPIPPKHWDDYCLDYLRCMQHEDPAECQTEPRSYRGDKTQCYEDLQVNRQQAVSIWPGRE